MTSVTIPTPIHSERKAGSLGAFVAFAAGMLVALTILLFVAAVGAGPTATQAPGPITAGPPSSEQLLGEHAAIPVAFSPVCQGVGCSQLTAPPNACPLSGAYLRSGNGAA